MWSIKRAVLVEVHTVGNETSPAYDGERADKAVIRARYATWYGISRHGPDDHP